MGSAVIIFLVVVVDWLAIVAVDVVVIASATTGDIVAYIAVLRGKVIGQSIDSFCMPIVWLDKVRIVVVVVVVVYYLITLAGFTRNERFWSIST